VEQELINKNLMKNILLLLISVFIISSSYAQLPPGVYTTTNKKAINLFEDAITNVQHNDNEKALDQCKRALEKDTNFCEPHLLIAEIYQSQNKTQPAIDEYAKALRLCPTYNLSNFYNIARLEMKIGNYKDAKSDFERFLKKPNINPDSKDIAKHQLENCNFALDALQHPVPFEPKNMGVAINSIYDEYFPAITADDQTFYYTRNNRTEAVPLQEDFLVSNKINGAWTSSKLVNGVNTPGNEGAPAISADGEILFFVACAEDKDAHYLGGRKGYGSCDIFYSQKVGKQWSNCYNLGPIVNSKDFESQPSFSADGKTLYFVSNRMGGYGDGDIWYTTLKDDGSWGPPINIGPEINTEGKEESVYIHPDGKTLYFSSSGHVGMGGLDIFVSRKDENGKWGTPVNLGYPINTYGDENSLLVSGSGDLAYMASNRAGGLGGLDLYEFPLYEKARPDKITYVKGKVYDAKTKAPLAAHFELIDLKTTNTIITSDANSGSGEFLVTLPVNKNYALNVSMPGYMFHSENFSLKEMKDNSKPYLMDIPMMPIDTGNVVVLNNVFFETAKWDLKPESVAELKKLIGFLNLNKKVRIELSGHTDDVGGKQPNIILSQNRAKAVYDYLIANGIDAKRLTYKGYGESKPKVKNDSDEHRQINRRTEFKIIEK